MIRRSSLVFVVACFSAAPAGAQESCSEILANGDSTGDGTYEINPGGAGAFDVYCDMSTLDGGWTLVGLIERASDLGHGDDFWYRNNGNWTDNSFSHAEMLSVDYANFNGDAKARAWTNVGGESLMFDCNPTTGCAAERRKVYTVNAFSSLSDLFSNAGEFTTTDNDDEVATFNHVTGRIFYAIDETYGRTNRDADGLPDAFIFVRDTPQEAVELLAFGAERVDGEVEVSWTTGAEVGCAQFEVLRCAGGCSEPSVSLGTTACTGALGGSHYVLRDDAPPTGALSYRLREHQVSGRTVDYATVTLTADGTMAVWDGGTRPSAQGALAAEPPASVADAAACAGTGRPSGLGGLLVRWRR